MKIYIAHSKNMNYIDELYKPVRNDEFLRNYEIILPHEDSKVSKNSREFYKTIDIFIAECSEPATGLGIELGWAYDDGKKIYCIHKEGTKINNSIRVVTNNIYEYKDSTDMINIIKNIINNLRGE